MLRKLLTLLLILFLIGLAGCTSKPPVIVDIPWKAADLRALEAPNAADASWDMIAAYARLTPTDLELRFDLLGSPDPYNYDLLVLLDTQPGGSRQFSGHQPVGLEWDLSLRFPAQGVGQALRASGEPANLRPRIQRLSVQDAAVVRLSRSELSRETNTRLEEIRFQAYLFVPGSAAPADSIGPLAINGAAPEARAALLLAFWDTLPSATPAQALRRWNGAHTGPYGQRHGLQVLLEAAAQSCIPLALLDLKQPTRLAALESLGGIALIQQMEKERLLILPVNAWGEPRAAAEGARFSEKAGQQNQLSNGPFFYGAVDNENQPGDYWAVFVRLQDHRHPRQWKTERYIPLPALEISPDAGEETQVNEEGLNITLRKELLQNALQSGANSLTVLGGSLPSSAWGDSLMAGPAFSYLAGHPWIQVLDSETLLRFPARIGTPDCADLLCLPENKAASPNTAQIMKALQDAPDGLFADLAWQTYLHLTEPTADEKLRSLRTAYLGQVGPLLAAAHWNAAPREQSICTEDLDWDGNPECVLSSQDRFLVIDPKGGRLVLLAARQNDQPYQIIGPRSQLVTGLGERLEWKPELGLAGDPQEIPGAFSDAPDAYLDYLPSASPGRIALAQPVSGVTKQFQLAEDEVRVEISNIAGESVMPLLLLGSQTWQPGGYARYHGYQNTPQDFTWELANGIRVQITAQNAIMAPTGFSQALSLISQPEDPNTELPPGAFLPFPLAVLELQTQGRYSVEIKIEPSMRK